MEGQRRVQLRFSIRVQMASIYVYSVYAHGNGLSLEMNAYAYKQRKWEGLAGV